MYVKGDIQVVGGRPLKAYCFILYVKSEIHLGHSVYINIKCTSGTEEKHVEVYM